jgi:hypothetical protein
MTGHSDMVLVLAVLALALSVRYLYSVWRYPAWRCWRCKGKARFFDSWKIWDRASRPCERCGGTGRLPRRGTKVFFPSRLK